MFIAAGGIVSFLKCIYFLASHVLGTHSFPQPLTPEEEAYHIRLCTQGSEESKNILIEHNLRLVAHIVKKYANTGKEVDDLISIGTIGLIKAISTFDPDKKTRLATYAARCIENEILMTIRADKKIRGEISLQDPIGVDKEGNEISLLDVLGSETDSVLDEVDLKLQIRKLYDKMQSVLKQREKMVLEMRYGLINGRIRPKEIARFAAYQVLRLGIEKNNETGQEFNSDGFGIVDNLLYLDVCL